MRQGDQLAITAVIGHTETMGKAEKRLSESEVAVARNRRAVAAHLQAIEDSPPDAEQTAMFEMFEREGWSHEQRRSYIGARARAAAAVDAAE